MLHQSRLVHVLQMLVILGAVQPSGMNSAFCKVKASGSISNSSFNPRSTVVHILNKHRCCL